MVQVINVDPKLLRESAKASEHAGSEAWRHMEAEYVGNIPNLMSTLRAEGPYAYSIMPEVHPDGTVKLPIATSREEVQKCYEFVRGRSDLLSSEAIVEIRGHWYAFHESVSHGLPKAPGSTTGTTNLLGLFPVSTDMGITGELLWVNYPGAKLGKEPRPADLGTDDLSRRRHAIVQHDRYITALRGGDIDGILATYNDGVQAVVRDYVNNTGGLVSLPGKEPHRDYYRALFKKYDVQSVELLYRVSQAWYVFSELRLTMREREGAGQTIAFHIAEMFAPAEDGRFIARVGHGTDPAAQ